MWLQDVSSGVIKVRNKPHFHGIAANCEYYRDRRGRRFGYFCRNPAERGNQGDPTLHQLIGERSQFRVLFCRSQIGRHVTTFDKAALLQAQAKSAHPVGARVIKYTNDRQRRLLGVRSGRPYCSHTTEKRE